MLLTRLLLRPLLRLLVVLLLLMLLVGSRMRMGDLLRSRPLRPGPRGRSDSDSDIARAVIIGRHCAAEIAATRGAWVALSLRATHH